MAKGKKPAKKGKKLVEKKVNPFELKFNRVKHSVLGQKRKSATSVGHPGLSKKKALDKRRATLQVEAENVHKVNKIVDSRIGEKNNALSEEDKAAQRFAAERIKGFNKRMFNLGDDDNESFQAEEVLTHGGQSLTSVQKYDKTMGSDSEDDGEMGAEIVARAHFGGGLAEGKEEEKGAGSTAPRTRDQIIGELILRTRDTRAQKADAKDAVEQQTLQLDDKFKSVLGKLSSTTLKPGEAKTLRGELDDYDTMLIDLKLAQEKRGQATERTKTVEEIASEDKERLEELERLRLARMNAKTNASVSKHLSMDMDIKGVPTKDLDQKKGRDKGMHVKFDQDGKFINFNKVVKLKKKTDADSDSEGEYDENEEELNDLMKGSDEEGEESDEDAENEEESDEEDDDEEESEDGEESEDEEEETVKTKKTAGSVQSKTEDTTVSSDIPFVFEMPKSYEELLQLVESYPPTEMETILERLIKCHHPSLKEGNKTRLARLLVFVLRFYDDLGKQTPSKTSVTQMGQLLKILYKLHNFDIEHGVRCVRALIRQFWKVRVGKGKHSTPSFNLIGTIRLVATLYPVTDVWHPVCTPMIGLLVHTLSQCHVVGLGTLAKQIMIATTMADYVHESKRYIPEVITFLRGALMLAIDGSGSSTDKFPSNVFPLSQPHRQMLLVEEDLSKTKNCEPLKLSEVFDEDEKPLPDTPLMRARVLRTLIAIIQKYSVVYGAHAASYPAIFSPFISLLSRLPLSLLPSDVHEEASALLSHMKAERIRNAPRVQMARVKTEQSMLKMLEPCFEDNFDPERPRLNRDPSRKGSKAELRKMQHMLKKEKRGAIKELRKDAQFLAKRKRDQEMIADIDRKEKVKTIMKGLQGQQHEANVYAGQLAFEKMKSRRRQSNKH